MRLLFDYQKPRADFPVFALESNFDIQLTYHVHIFPHVHYIELSKFDSWAFVGIILPLIFHSIIQYIFSLSIYILSFVFK